MEDGRQDDGGAGGAVDGVTGATVCAQLQQAGGRVLAEAGGKGAPPPGTTWEELLEYGFDQVKR